MEHIAKVTATKATYVLLLRGDKNTTDLAVRALEQLEWAFNKNHPYPVTIFHEKDDMPEEARSQLRRAAASSTVNFVEVEFQIPDFLDRSKIPEKINLYDRDFSIGYRHMCRFFAGDIIRHPALEGYDYIMRVDADSEYLCPIDYDLFRYCKNHKIKYAYDILLYEWKLAREGIWDATRDFIKQRGLPSNKLKAYANMWGEYDGCHFWNNFEIMDLNWFKTSGYLDYFDHIDRNGGIYYSRWGDAIIRTLGVELFAKPGEVHLFPDLGYKHATECTNRCGREAECHNNPDGMNYLCKGTRRYMEWGAHSDLQRFTVFFLLFCMIGGIVTWRFDLVRRVRGMMLKKNVGGKSK